MDGPLVGDARAPEPALDDHATRRLEDLRPSRGHVLLHRPSTLAVELDGEVLVTTPDLIVVVDAETGEPITTETLRFGHRVAVVAAPMDERWHTPAGLELVGPRYFGYDVDPIRFDGSHSVGVRLGHV